MTGKKLGNGAERRKRRGTAAAVRARSVRERSVGAKSAEANSAEARTAEGSAAKKRGQAGQTSASAPVSKNDEVVLDIIGLTHDGEGVGRADGFTLFVSGALPGSRCGRSC